MNWIKLDANTEIMQAPVTIINGGSEQPLRGLTYDAATAYAAERSWRLPTEDEWLAGWKNGMQHWGLYEWTSTIDGPLIVLRGGSWDLVSSFLMASVRSGFHPGYWLHFIGFRCVRCWATP